jgi:hypothetical protein
MMDNVSMSNYRPTSFVIQELVPPIVFNCLGGRAWELLDPRATLTLQQLRDKFGPLTVNNWHTGGSYHESGLRSPLTTTGAKFSQHKFGRAFDCKFKGHTPREVAEYVLQHAYEFPQLTTIENPDATPTWFHFDVRAHSKEGIWVVNP